MLIHQDKHIFESFNKDFEYILEMFSSKIIFIIILKRGKSPVF